ncbi:hypothetical protein DEO72_LG5g2421 [Vigna unguiculata]|uniref:Uncharacterized protein n=1 Tax=Vigna unguiculata TaxID=3917 RepID=A0A4D6M174_VIGUN|nr:hypothetical protein DEO72_LG5g2421 [Vigna unguiculata]
MPNLVITKREVGLLFPSREIKEDVNRGESSVSTRKKDVNRGKAPGSKKNTSVSDAKPCDNKEGSWFAISFKGNKGE